MSEALTGKVAIGEIVGFKKLKIPVGRNVKVLVKVKDSTIAILVDDSQIDFIRAKYAAGRKVAVGVYGGEWHIGMPPIKKLMAEKSASDDDLLNREMEDIDIVKLVMEPQADEIGSEMVEQSKGPHGIENAKSN